MVNWVEWLILLGLPVVTLLLLLYFSHEIIFDSIIKIRECIEINKEYDVYSLDCR